MKNCESISFNQTTIFSIIRDAIRIPGKKVAGRLRRQDTIALHANNSYSFVIMCSTNCSVSSRPCNQRTAHARRDGLCFCGRSVRVCGERGAGNYRGNVREHVLSDAFRTRRRYAWRHESMPVSCRH